jgi:hypothetical protein
VVLVDVDDGKFWREWLKFVDEHVAADGYVSRGDECFFSLANSAEEAVGVIRNFYRNYHSLRMVRSRAVLRLHRAPSAEQLAAVNEKYAAMVVDGQIESTTALPVEISSKDFPELPRLIWEFNRRDYGLLRQLIDDVNSWAG